MSAEGKAEAATYDKFACFCKSKTDEKVKAIASLLALERGGSVKLKRKSRLFGIEGQTFSK